MRSVVGKCCLMSEPHHPCHKPCGIQSCPCPFHNPLELCPVSHPIVGTQQFLLTTLPPTHQVTLSSFLHFCRFCQTLLNRDSQNPPQISEVQRGEVLEDLQIPVAMWGDPFSGVLTLIQWQSQCAGIQA